MVEAICSALDALLPAGVPHRQLITPVTDRPGHDRRDAIDPTRISSELGWQPRHSFQEGLVPPGAGAGRHQRRAAWRCGWSLKDPICWHSEAQGNRLKTSGTQPG